MSDYPACMQGVFKWLKKILDSISPLPPHCTPSGTSLAEMPNICAVELASFFFFCIFDNISTHCTSVSNSMNVFIPSSQLSVNSYVSNPLAWHLHKLLKILCVLTGCCITEQIKYNLLIFLEWHNLVEVLHRWTNLDRTRCRGALPRPNLPDLNSTTTTLHNALPRPGPPLRVWCTLA